MSTTRLKLTPAARFVASIAIIVFTTCVCPAQQPTGQLPTVVSASDPIYPAMARRISIQGTVLLRVTTDGKQVSNVQIESGPAMLAIAAQENVRTWRFKQHNPTSFETTFRYTLLADEIDCLPDFPSDKGTVLLNLPNEVDLTVKRLVLCDTPVDYTKPALVEFTVTLDGKEIAQPNQLTFKIGDHSIQIPLQSGRIELPPEVLQAKSVELSMIILGDQIRVQDIFGGKFTQDPLKLCLADKPFSSEYRWANGGGGAKSSCVLLFEGGEPGTVLIQRKCRTRIKK